MLRVHTRVADLYNEPMDQTEQQLRLTIEALRERQEHELINNRDFGLLHNADLKQRIHTRSGPPTPDDLDELLSRRRKTQFFLAHPRAIAAFGRECSSRGIYPRPPRWRAARARLARRAAAALRQDPDHRARHQLDPRDAHRRGQPGRDRPAPDRHPGRVRARPVRPVHGHHEKAIISYLVSAYYSAAVLVPDALGVLENVEIGH